MVPTRELAIQIAGSFQYLGKNTRVNTFSVFGGVEQGPQIAKLEKGIDILVTTPGRMFDLASQGFIKLNRVEILVLDGARSYAGPWFYQRYQRSDPSSSTERQTLFFSHY
ncbi:MAG: DEAD/DEAH box helicase [Saprospiraceae bacterium]|nr:DEAD/DEAH box helicase [Saprospiraceae bacterium]